MKTLSQTKIDGNEEFSKIPTQTTGEISLYFHIPFCLKKCPYCHFYSTKFEKEMKSKFLKALHQEIALQKPIFENKKIISLYFGGGTPSLLEIDELASIIDLFPKDPSIEITLEVNPELKEFKKFPVNRVSIGVQSFDDQLLKNLKRGHTFKDSLKTIENFYTHGIENISIDLMLDIPEQTLSSLEKSLKIIEKLPIKHISLYNLILEENTPFYRAREELLKLLPKEPQSLKLLKRAISQFSKFGFKRYEISAFAKENFSSRHNLGYWTKRPFLGFGPSAFSYINGSRFKNVSNLADYIESIKKRVIPIDFEETLYLEQATRELLAIGLRVIDGVELDSFIIDEETKKRLEYLKKEKFISNTKCKLTAKGLLFYDTVASYLVGE